MQEDRKVRFEAEHQRAPNAATIALTIATSSAEHSSSSFTPLGRWADSRASRVERGETQDDSALVARCDVGLDAMGVIGSSIAITGIKADAATGPSWEVRDCGRSRARTHLCNWLAFTPAFRARPDNDAPGRRQASTSRRLSVGSKLRLPPPPTPVPPHRKKLSSSSLIHRS